MKNNLNILLLLGAALFLPINAQAYWGVMDTNVSDLWTLPAATATLDIAMNTSLMAGYDIYNNMYNWNAPLGEALSVTPEVSPSMAAMYAKNYHQIEAMHEELNRQTDYQIKPAKKAYLTPKELWAKIKAFRAGDVTKIIREKIAAEIDKIYDQLEQQYEKIVSGEMFANLIQDIASCKTPQLDTMFPKININAGFGMCDYKQMFNNMQDQVKSISDKGWGGSFMINGKNASDVIKNPALLKNSLHLIPPGQGHALVADFLSKESTNYSIQGGLDTSAIGNQIAGTLKHLDGYDFKPRTMIDAVNDTVRVGALSSKAQVAGTNATNQILAAQAQMQSMQVDRDEQLRQMEAMQQTAARVSTALSGSGL